MCLIIHKPAGLAFEEHWLRDFHTKNSDGYGFLYSIDGRLHVHKSMGNADRFVQAFEARKDYECLIHLRMRTHGDTDLDNCHPYEVLTSEEGGKLGAVWMMHNGILSHGNDPDKTKSDTWHYINSWLKPILRKCPELLLDAAFQGLVMNDIGHNNKFTFMSASGEVVILNKDEGIMWRDAWMSNTYAWNAYGEGGARRTYPAYSGYGGAGNYGTGSYSTPAARPSWAVYENDAWDYENGTHDPLADVPVIGGGTTVPAMTEAERIEDAELELEMRLAAQEEAHDEATQFLGLLQEMGFVELLRGLTFYETEKAFLNAPDEMEDLYYGVANEAYKPPEDDQIIRSAIEEYAGWTSASVDTPDIDNAAAS